MIPGGASHTTLEKIGYVEDIAANPAQPESLRGEAAAGLERIEAGDPVHPIYLAIREAAEAAREVREPEPYPVRAFIQTWRELASWWTHYDTAALAAQLTDEQYEKFLATADGTLRFADELRAARDATETRPHLRAL